jgi:hypothetical protein
LPKKFAEGVGGHEKYFGKGYSPHQKFSVGVLPCFKKCFTLEKFFLCGNFFAGLPRENGVRDAGEISGKRSGIFFIGMRKFSGTGFRYYDA